MTAPLPTADHFRFVRAHTRIAPVPLLPTIRLHQADDAFLLWETTERDLALQGMPLPFWAFPWAGGIALARHVLEHRGLVEGRRVLDIGTGSGLIAIAAAQAGAACPIANDVDPLALAAVELNALANLVAVKTALGGLLDEPRDSLFERVDVVLAGDVAYERAMSDRVFSLLFRLADRGIDVYVGDPGRAHLPGARLERIHTYDVPVTRAVEAADVLRTTVWRVTA